MSQMSSKTSTFLPDLSLISAPMVGQSDLPFRILVQRYGATLAYTQMLHSDRLIHDQDYLEFHLRDLSLGPAVDWELSRPVVVQLCGNDPDTVVSAAKKVVGYCDAIDLNLGCPQERAREGHFGAYLLGQKDWPLIENIVSSLAHALPVPVSTKLRLCQPASSTLALAHRLEASGASWITLHARHVSAQRRRQGAAFLNEVKCLKDDNAGVRVPVVSNGNVRTWEDVAKNREETGADGVMVGETLLGNPCLFASITPDPVLVSLEYLELCRQYTDTATMDHVRAHIRHFIEYQCSRKPWYNSFRTSLSKCQTLVDVEKLLRYKVQRWRGQPVMPINTDEGSVEGAHLEEDGDEQEQEQESDTWMSLEMLQ